MNARSTAIARENAEIDSSTERAIAARQAEQSRPKNALEAMAERLQVSPGGLKDTLMKTVFSACNSEAEFVALTIVANTYGLNPLTKEIYAFPKKGGGIMPMIAYDGWVKIMNQHPQFDGIEFNHTLDDKGNIMAVEGVIYRKDRSRPTKKLIYLREFKKNTDPWNNSPSHMLDVRCLCHTVRLAFGIHGGIEGDDEAIALDGGVLTPDPMPSRKSLAEELDDEIPTFDKQTGEIQGEPARDDRGMTVVDEETQRSLDAAQTAQDIDGPLQADEPQQEEERAPWQDNVDQIKADIAAAQSRDALKAVEQDFVRLCGSWSKVSADEVEALITQRRGELS